MAVDSSGNLYIAAGSTVVKVGTSGKSTVVAGGGPNTGNGLVGDGGPATSAVLSDARAVAVDVSGNLFIADESQGRIRKVSADGTISTIAGPGPTNGALGDGGPALYASFGYTSPQGVAVDSSGNVYAADYGNNRVRKITPDGLITTVAGGGKTLGDGGPATGATLNNPYGVRVDPAGNLYIADEHNNRIRKVTPDGIITTVAGNGNGSYSGDGGLATIAAINTPQDVAVDSAGELCIADMDRVRLITSLGTIYEIAGIGTTNNIWPSGYGPTGVAFGAGGTVYVAGNGEVIALSPTGKTITVPPLIASGGVFGASAFGGFRDLAPGGWVEIYGSYLGTTSRSWSAGDFSGVNAPTSLDGTSVKIGGQPAYISYVSPGQVNAQVPSNIGTGQQPLVVTTKSGSGVTYAVTVNPQQPGLLAPPQFYLGSNSSGFGGLQYATAVFSDGTTFVLPPGAIPGISSRYASAGDTITLYGVGFGFVSPSVPAGQIVQSPNMLTLPLQVYFNNTPGTVTYAGLAPGAVGLYQINVVIPKLTISGNPPAPAYMTFSLGGVTGGQGLYIAVH